MRDSLYKYAVLKQLILHLNNFLFYKAGFPRKTEKKPWRKTTVTKPQTGKAVSKQEVARLTYAASAWYGLTKAADCKCHVTPAILSRDFVARQSRSVIRIAGSHVCLSHAASKLQRATMKSHAATLSRVRVARQNRAIKSQV